MGFLGMVVANNLFEIAGAVALAVGFYNLGMWKQRRFPTLQVLTLRTIGAAVLAIIVILFLLHWLFK